MHDLNDEEPCTKRSCVLQLSCAGRVVVISNRYLANYTVLYIFSLKDIRTGNIFLEK